MQRKIGNHLPIEAALPPQIGRNPRLERLAQLFDWERVGAVVYESKQRRRWLKRRGIKDRIMHRSHKYQARLPYWQRQRNRRPCIPLCRIVAVTVGATFQ